MIFSGGYLVTVVLLLLLLCTAGDVPVSLVVVRGI